MPLVDETWTDWASRNKAIDGALKIYDEQAKIHWKTKENYARWLRDLDIRDREVHGAIKTEE